MDSSKDPAIPVSPNKGDNGEKEEQQHVIKDLKRENEELKREREELRKDKIRVLEKENKELKEESKVISQVQSELHVLKLEQQVKLQFRFELVTACIHIFSLVVCILAFCQGWFKMHVDDMSSRNWWSWWYSEVLEGLSGETFYVCVLCLNLLLALFKFIFVYLIST